jgi:hypothetical protein
MLSKDSWGSKQSKKSKAIQSEKFFLRERGACYLGK